MDYRMFKLIRTYASIVFAGLLLAFWALLATFKTIWLHDESFKPRGEGHAWDSELILLNMISDTAIGSSLLIVFFLLVYVSYKCRSKATPRWMFNVVGVFALTCALGYFLAVWTPAGPYYRMETALKLGAAVIAVILAGVLPFRLPHILNFINAVKISEESSRQMQVHTAAVKSINDMLENEVAQRKKAEAALVKMHDEALRHSEMRYQTLAEIAPVGIFRTDATGSILYVNTTWCKIAGVTSESVAEGGWYGTIHPDDSAQINNSWLRGAQEDNPVTREFRFRHRDGSVRWVIGNAHAELDATGQVAGYVGTITDISDLKKFEESLQRSAEVARSINEELSFYKFALDQAAIVAVTDAAGTITTVNDKFCQISGYDRQELVGKNHRVLNSSYHPKSYFTAMYDAIAQGKVWRGEVRNRARDGQYYWVDMTIIPTLDAARQVTRYVAICADITERKKAESALEVQRVEVEMANHALANKNEQLSELYKTAQRFVDDVSHEFRTPLSVIKGYSELMQAGIAGPVSSEQKRFSQLIIDRSRDMAQMVDDLLDTSKLRAGSLRVDRAPCSVASIFAAIHPFIDSRISANKIQWVEEIEPGLPEVFADAEKAGRVLVNLVVNAIKFSPEGSRIVLTAKTNDKDEVVIAVADQGPGISPENLAVLFERFRQVGNTATVKGFGLGLNIAKELAFLNLGELSVASELQKGSTFSFTLPLNQPRVIMAKLLAYLEHLQTPAGTFAVLRATPRRESCSLNELRGFLASSSHPGDVIMAAPDNSALVLFGYSAKPSAWHRRLAKIGGEIEEFNPKQKLCPFNVELVSTVSYPTSLETVVSLVETQIQSEAAHV
jgi:PAS domain S-box-containing protein